MWGHSISDFYADDYFPNYYFEWSFKFKYVISKDEG